MVRESTGIINRRLKEQNKIIKIKYPVTWEMNGDTYEKIN